MPHFYFVEAAQVYEHWTVNFSVWIYNYCGLLFHFTAPNLQHAAEIGLSLRKIADELDGNYELNTYVCSPVKLSIYFQEKVDRSKLNIQTAVSCGGWVVSLARWLLNLQFTGLDTSGANRLIGNNLEWVTHNYSSKRSLSSLWGR